MTYFVLFDTFNLPFEPSFSHLQYYIILELKFVRQKYPYRVEIFLFSTLKNNQSPIRQTQNRSFFYDVCETKLLRNQVVLIDNNCNSDCSSTYEKKKLQIKPTEIKIYFSHTIIVYLYVCTHSVHEKLINSPDSIPFYIID